MNSFFNSMLVRMGLPLDSAVGLKITICDLSGMLIEGHKGIVSYAPSSIAIRTKNCKLIIIGKNLSIMEITPDEVYVRGKILSMAVEDV